MTSAGGSVAMVEFAHWAARILVPQSHWTVLAHSSSPPSERHKHPASKGTAGHPAEVRKDEPPSESNGARHVVHESGILHMQS